MRTNNALRFDSEGKVFVYDATQKAEEVRVHIPAPVNHGNASERLERGGMEATRHSLQQRLHNARASLRTHVIDQRFVFQQIRSHDHDDSVVRQQVECLPR